MGAIETTTSLPADARSPGLARRFVSAALHEAGAEALADVTTLLVSELVTNAVLHALADVDLRLCVEGGSVRVEVRDSSATPAVPRHFGSDAATGRGLLLVDQLAAAWGSEEGRDGKCVWFELPGEAGERWTLGESA